VAGGWGGGGGVRGGGGRKGSARLRRGRVVVLRPRRGGMGARGGALLAVTYEYPARSLRRLTARGNA